MQRDKKYTTYIFLGFILGMIMLFTVSLLWNLRREHQQMLKFAKIEAEASYNKDLVYRRWAAKQGGVYVKISEHTPPNKYLEFLPNRDITTPGGEQLTLVNPAYMTRQVLELAKQQYGVKGHITSLNPIRPENLPDPWEILALQHFSKADDEYFSVEKMDSLDYLRFMKPLLVEESCMKCHSSQGYKIGDIRGGISVSVPLDKYYEIEKHDIRVIFFLHITIFVIILIVSFFVYRFFLKEIRRRDILRKDVLLREEQLELQNAQYEILNKELHDKYSEIATSEEELRASNEELVATTDALVDSNRDLLIAMEKAEEGNRLKTAFLQNISHEIRTPMNAIIGFASMLDRFDLSAEKRKTFTSIIINSSNQLLSIVTDILTISSLEAGLEKLNFTNVALNTMLYELMRMYESQSKIKNITLNYYTALADGEDVISTDYAKLSQILNNLLSNAVKFTHKGEINFGYKIDKHNLVFFVTDTGIGIEQSLHKKIFERFRQADLTIGRQYGGTGLGLSIVEGFVNLLGGNIRVESELQKGSSFFFTLPNILSTNYMPKEVLKRDARLQITILIAEDEMLNYMLLEEILLDSNMIIVHAKNGKEAVEICRTNPKIELVLMDIRMPEMQGDAAAEQIKKMRPELPIIAQSAYVHGHIDNNFNILYFDDSIAKPINHDELLQKILKFVNK